MCLKEGFKQILTLIELSSSIIAMDNAVCHSIKLGKIFVVVPENWK